jgi:tetratricopeptide (TPR) repeat protein
MSDIRPPHQRGNGPAASGRQIPPRARAARARALETENYFGVEWLLLIATYVTMTLIFFLFTPYTHQLDEIKNLLLGFLPPFLLLAAVYFADFSRMTWRTHGSTYLLGLFVVAMVISYLINPHKDTGERVVWFQTSCATFTVIFAWFMNTENKLRKTLLFLVFICLGSVAVGLFLYAGRGFTTIIYNAMQASMATGSGLWARNPEWVTLFYTLKESTEMYSTILNSDFYAAFLVMTLPFVLAMFFVEEHPLFKSLAVITFLLMNVCLFFTNSNDSFLSVTFVTYPVFFVLGYLYVRSWNLSRRFVASFFAGSAVLGATIALLMYPKLSQTWDFKSEAIYGRKILWMGGFWPWLYRDDASRSAIDWLSVIFGTGPGGYRFYFPVHRDPTFFDNQINNVTTFGHNWYLDVLLEYGALGLLIFLAFHVRVLADAFRQVRTTESRAHQFYQIAAISSLLGIGLQNWFSPNNRWAVCGMIYWSIFGLSMGIHHIDTPGALAGGSAQARRGPVVVKWLTYAFVGLFLLRSVPLSIDYWRGALANARGLRLMDTADLVQGTRKTDFLMRSSKEFDRAIAYNPTFATSYYKQGHVLNQLQDTERAIERYEQLQKVFPHYSEIHLNLGIMYSAKADGLKGAERVKWLEKAFASSREAARQSLKSNIQWIAGIIGEEYAAALAEQGEDKKAAEVYEQVKPYYRSVVEYKPRLPEVVMERERLYKPAQERLVRLGIQTGKPLEAIEMLRKMYIEDPDNVGVLNRLLRLYDEQKMIEEKVKFLTEAVHNAPLNPELRLRLAEAHLAAGNRDEYIKQLRKVEYVDPGNVFALGQLYAVLSARGATEQAAQYRDKLSSAGVSVSRITPWTAADLETTNIAPLLTRLRAQLTTGPVRQTTATAPSGAGSTPAPQVPSGATTAPAAETSPGSPAAAAGEPVPASS